MKEELDLPATIEFFNDIDSEINDYVKSIWFSSGKIDGENPPFKLMPMNHLDLVIVLKGEAKIILNDVELTCPKVMFQGLAHNILDVMNNKSFKVFGISFKPWGLYPFLHKPIDKIISKDYTYKSEDLPVVDDLMDALQKYDDKKTLIHESQRILKKHVKSDNIFYDILPIIKEYVRDVISDIGGFCESKGIHSRKFERDFKRYVGVTPRAYRRIKQIVRSSRLILKGKDSLATIGLDSEFYDQAHFNKHFKNYIGYTPKDFKDKAPALMGKMDFK